MWYFTLAIHKSEPEHLTISLRFVDARLTQPYPKSPEWAGSFHKPEEHNQRGGEKNERSLVRKDFYNIFRPKVIIALNVMLDVFLKYKQSD